VLLWIYHDNPQEEGLLSAYVAGVFFGVIPTLFFFGAVWLGLRKGFPLSVSLVTGLVVWIVSAFLHQLLLK
ncbi:MAG TPA: hypothetical protein VFF53_12050, partial [Geobacteraceae bacterium]|nr:hypothetical protein [Geobacteraceae bacterium]